MTRGSLDSTGAQARPDEGSIPSSSTELDKLISQQARDDRPWIRREAHVAMSMSAFENPNPAKATAGRYSACAHHGRGRMTIRGDGAVYCLECARLRAEKRRREAGMKPRLYHPCGHPEARVKYYAGKRTCLECHRIRRAALRRKERDGHRMQAL